MLYNCKTLSHNGGYFYLTEDLVILANFPVLTQTPMVSFDVDSSGARRELIFLCTLPDKNAIEAGLQAEIVWFVGEEEITQHWNIPVIDLPHKLKEADWKSDFTIGHEVLNIKLYM